MKGGTKMYIGSLKLADSGLEFMIPREKAEELRVDPGKPFKSL